MSKAAARSRVVLRSRQATDSLTLPPEFVLEARRWLGQESESFLNACVQTPQLAIRANVGKGGLPRLSTALAIDSAEWPHVPWWFDAVLPPPSAGARLASHLLARIGALYAQDPAALAAVATLDPQPGERILDLCAAPGGKSTAIADRLRGQGLLVSNDVDIKRAWELARTMERWGATNIAVLAQTPQRLCELVPGFFDRILVDAPCSGEAMFGKHQQAAVDWSIKHVKGCAQRQIHLLEVARRLVQPGGILVYATCTFNQYENENVIAAYLNAFPTDVVEDATALLPGSLPGRPDLLSPNIANLDANSVINCARLWPHRVVGAGHFIARIRVNTRATQLRPARAHANNRLTKAIAVDKGEAWAIVDSVAPEWAASTGGIKMIRGDTLILLPSELPEMMREVSLVPGLAVAKRRGRTWQPAHALAMAARTDHATVLDDAAASLFFSGQEGVANTDATVDDIVLATWRGYSLGWARRRGNRLTSLLPKGLRASVSVLQPSNEPDNE